MQAASPGDEIHFVFADTKMEDEDLYRFLAETRVADEKLAAELGLLAFFHDLADGRDVWDVFFAERFMGNSRIDPCSKILKRNLIRSFLDENFDPADTLCYIGIDWSEEHRFLKAVPYWRPFTVLAPLTQPPYIDKDGIRAELAALGIAQPRLYDLGFAHNNCGGFCVKAGQGAFKTLLRELPDRYDYHAGREQEFRAFVGKDVSILKDRTLAGRLRVIGLTEADVDTYVENAGEDDEERLLVHRETRTVLDVPPAASLPLTVLRKRIEGDPSSVDDFDIGGCACFTPDLADDSGVDA